MIDIINLAFSRPEVEYISHDFDDILVVSTVYQADIEVKPFVQLEPSDRRQVVTLRIKKQSVKKVPSSCLCRGLAGPELLVYLDKRLFLGPTLSVSSVSRSEDR